MAQGNDASSVGVGKPKVTGAVFIAPITAALPTNATDELPDEYECIGYVSEDGFTVSEERDNEDIPAWGGDTVYTSQTSYTESFSFTPIEINPVVAKMQYGDENVTVTAGAMTVVHNSKELPAKHLVVDTVPNSKTVSRLVVPLAKLTEKGDLTFNDSDPVGRESTFTAQPDESGNTAYEYHAITGLAAE